MPIQSGNGGSDGFLNVLGHPPIMLLFKVANRNESGSGSNGKLVFFRAPFDTTGRTVDPQQDQHVFPGAIRLQVPNVGIAISRASDNSIGFPAS